MSAPDKPDAAMELQDILDDLACTMRPLLEVASYVASSHAVLDGIRAAAQYDKVLEKRMTGIHPLWREPDCSGDVLMSLAQLLTNANTLMFQAQERAAAVKLGDRP
jgi:hypothetical protein